MTDIHFQGLCQNSSTFEALIFFLNLRLLKPRTSPGRQKRLLWWAHRSQHTGTKLILASNYPLLELASAAAIE